MSKPSKPNYFPSVFNNRLLAYKALSGLTQVQYNLQTTSRMQQINIWSLTLLLAIYIQLSLAADDGKEEHIYCIRILNIDSCIMQHRCSMQNTRWNGWTLQDTTQL